MTITEKSCVNCGRYHCDHLDSDWPDFCMTTNNSQEIFEEAPVTYLIVKDRVLAHNPAGALYQSSMYYRRIMEPGFPPERARASE